MKIIQQIFFNLMSNIHGICTWLYMNKIAVNKIVANNLSESTWVRH